MGTKALPRSCCGELRRIHDRRERRWRHLSGPRAVKTRPEAYPYLTTLRGDYIEIPHRSSYREAA